MPVLIPLRKLVLPFFEIKERNDSGHDIRRDSFGSGGGCNDLLYKSCMWGNDIL
jgi:hypothetical protein